MKILIKVFVINSLLLSFVFAGEIAISFDDAPMRDMAFFKGSERTARLIKILNQHDVKAVFFANSNKLDKFNGRKRLQQYGEAGHFIANHTDSHLDLRKNTALTYNKEIDRADTLLRSFPNFKKWFRYPFLAHGDNLNKRDRVREHLSKLQYKNGYVTADNQDWFMASLIDKHKSSGGNIDEDKLCKSYSQMLWDSISFFDSQAKRYFKKSPRHMLLLHENDLSALCLQSLILKIKSEGWAIVSPEYVIRDKIYSYKPDTIYNKNGQIAALIHEKYKVKIKFPWEDTKEIEKEFTRQEILY